MLCTLASRLTAYHLTSHGYNGCTVYHLRPRTSDLYVSRPRLLEALPDEAGYVVWLEAPYGYGKSVLAAQWAELLEATGWRVLWLSLRGGSLLGNLISLLNLPENTPWNMIHSYLWEQPTLLVLEDLTDTTELGALLGNLQGLILLESRNPLSDSHIAQRLADGTLIHLTAEDLAFTLEESSNLTDDPHQARQLFEQTRGWSLPLHFAVLTGRMPDARSLLEGIHESVTTTSWQELLFLAALPYLPLDSATPATDTLVSQGFVQRLEGNYRLHPFVADIIFEMYADDVRAAVQQGSERLPPLLQGQAFERCHDTAGLSEVLRDPADTLWRQDPERVVYWDSLTEPPYTAAHHRTVGRALGLLGRTAEGLERLNFALAAEGLTTDQRLLIINALCWAQATHDLGAALVSVQMGEDLLERATPELAGRFLGNASYVDFVAGRFDSAIAKLERALSYLPKDSPFRVANRNNLALNLWDKNGDLMRRLTVQLEILDDVWQLYPSDAPGMCRDIAMMYWWLGQTAEAKRYLEQGLTGARANPIAAIEIQATLANLTGDIAAAVPLLRQADAWQDPYTQDVVLMHASEVFRKAGDLVTATTLYQNGTPGELARSAYALVLAAQGAQSAALQHIDDTLADCSDRASLLYLHSARYRISRTEQDLEAFLNLTKVGTRILPGFIPLAELPDRPELTTHYPISDILASDWPEVIRMRQHDIPPLHITLLGQLEVTHLGRRLELTDRLKQLISLLVLELDREAIGTAMWPETDRQKVRNNLNVQFNFLRRVLEPWGIPVFLSDKGLQHVQTDVATLHHALESGDTATILATYREPVAPGIDAMPIADFRVTLRQRVTDYLFDAAATDSDFAEPCLERILELDPLSEDALQQLLRRLVAQGRPRAAWRHYRAFARRLQDELDLDPLEETRTIIEF